MFDSEHQFKDQEMVQNHLSVGSGRLTIKIKWKLHL